MNYNEYEWLEKAKQSIESLKCGDTFVLSQLLYSSGWETLSKGDRIKFGKQFKEDVLNNKIPEIILISKKGVSKYRKIKNS